MRAWLKNPFSRGPATADPTILPPPSEDAKPRRLEKLPFGAKCFFDPFDPLQYPTNKRAVTVAGCAPPPPTPTIPPPGAATGSPTEEEGFVWDGEVDDSAAPSPTASESFTSRGDVMSTPSQSPMSSLSEMPRNGSTTSNAAAAGGSPAAKSGAVGQPLSQPHVHHHHAHTETEEQLVARLKKERALVDEMQARLGIVPPEESQARFKLEIELLRYIRARKYNVDQAIEQYKNTQKFRAENKVDEMWDDPIDPLAKYFQNIAPHRNIGYDYEGQPVYYERTGLVRVPEMLKYMTEADPIRRHIRHLEHIGHRMQYLSYRHQRNITKCVIVQDLTNLSYAPDAAAIRIFKATANVDQTYYPERLSKIFLINAPMSFRAVWATIKVFVDANTRQKIEILGTNYQQRLLQVIPADQLPKMYGGTLELVWPNGDGCLPNVRPAEAEDFPEDWQPILLKEGEPMPDDAEPLPPSLPQ